MHEQRIRVLEVWIAELYERLRLAEARAADTQRSPPDRRADIAAAQHIAREIEYFQDELLRRSAPQLA